MDPDRATDKDRDVWRPERGGDSAVESSLHRQQKELIPGDEGDRQRGTGFTASDQTKMRMDQAGKVDKKEMDRFATGKQQADRFGTDKLQADKAPLHAEKTALHAGQKEGIPGNEADRGKGHNIGDPVRHGAAPKGVDAAPTGSGASRMP